MEARRFALSELFMISPVIQALLAGLMTWAITAAGAALVLLLRRSRHSTLDAMLAFGGGVMMAASYWSLLAPGIELAVELALPAATLVALGFLCGGLLLMAADWLLTQHMASSTFTTSHRRAALLISSITIHNIPEGLAVGVSFGAAALHPSPAAFTAAWLLALGVGLQNFPEGAAVSLPLRREGMRRSTAFFWGQASALVEPVSAVIGALMAVHIRPLLPFALSFAAGAMICAVVSELLPESQRSSQSAFMTFFTLLGFTVMMVLDVSLG